MNWIITKITRQDNYSVVEIRCPKCGFKETLTRYKYEDKERKCYLCEDKRTLPELGDEV